MGAAFSNPRAEEHGDFLGVSPRILVASAKAAMQGAQVLSQTDIGGGQNALAAILGNGGAGSG